MDSDDKFGTMAICLLVVLGMGNIMGKECFATLTAKSSPSSIKMVRLRCEGRRKEAGQKRFSMNLFVLRFSNQF